MARLFESFTGASRLRDATSRGIVLALVGCWLAIGGARAAIASRVLDITTFTPPPGWNVEEKSSGATKQVVLSRASSTSYCMIVLNASTPASGGLEASFAAEWKSVALQTISPVPTPKPDRRTVGNTQAAVGGAASTIQRQPAVAMLAVLDAATRVVSILILSPTVATFEAYHADVQAFLASVTVQRVNAPAASPAKLEGGKLVIPPAPRGLTIADLAGEWGRNDGINTTYVDRYTGSYAGTDSIHFTEGWVITADGGISSDFFGVQNGRKITEKSAGTVTLSNAGILVIKMTKQESYVLRGWLVGPNMTVMTLNGPWYNGIPPDILSNPIRDGIFDKRWVRLAKKL